MNCVITYDAAGNISQRDNRLSGHSFTTSYQYTHRNQIKSVNQQDSIATFSYNAVSNLDIKTYPHGDVSSYGYEQDNRLTGMNATKDGVLLQGFSQAFDANGNITSASQTAAGSASYTYDALNRLTAENMGGYGNVSYSYDKTGNRLTTDNPTTGLVSYTYNEANQLTASINDNTTTDYAYDDSGALTQKSDGTTIDYTCDALGGASPGAGTRVNDKLPPQRQMGPRRLRDGRRRRSYPGHAQGADGLIGLTSYSQVSRRPWRTAPRRPSPTRRNRGKAIHHWLPGSLYGSAIRDRPERVACWSVAVRRCCHRR